MSEPKRGLRIFKRKNDAGSVKPDDSESGIKNNFGKILAKLDESRSFRKLKAWWKRYWAGLVVALVSTGLLIAAFIVPGVKTADLYLNNSFVYVVNQNSMMVGSLNMQIDELADASRVGSQRSQILQEEDTVIVYSQSSGQLQQYNPAKSQMSSPVTLPVGATVTMGGGKVVVTNPDNGKVFVNSVETTLDTEFQTAQAQLDVGQYGLAVATPTGGVAGVNVQTSQLVRYENGEVITADLPFEVDPLAPNLQVSTFDGKAVVLDRTMQRLWIEGDRNPIDVSGASNAQLAPATAGMVGSEYKAVYATSVGLIGVDKDGTKSLSGPITGTPIRPVVVGKCAYGAFSSQVATACSGEAPQIQDIPDLPEDAELAFQTNRGQVVLQDQVAGRIWLVNEGMKIVDNWDQVNPPDIQDQTIIDEDTPLPERDEKNRPPIANDDLNLAARAGRTTVLPVLDNDSDPDGDVLTISVDKETIDDAKLSVTGSTSLQITLPDQPSGKAYDFEYTISDGRGGTDSARVVVQPLPADQSVSNRAPYHFKSGNTLKVGRNGTMTKRVLLDWRDPDGDEMILVDAISPNVDDEVSFTPDGELTFNDVGKTTGTKRVEIFVSDGSPTPTKSVLNVEVSEEPVVAPIAYADFATTRPEREVVIAPLANDAGVNLRLSEVSQSTDEFTVTPNYTDSTFTFEAKKEGVYYVVYQVNNGMTATGLVRIDVTGSSAVNRPPVAAPDLALVPIESDGSVLIDPLANDIDPDGDVLVLQSVTSDPRLKIIMHDRRMLTISAVQALSEPIPLTYYISDGQNRVAGTIIAMPSPVVGDRTPKARNDQVSIRTGSTATVSVLKNDESPVGFDLTVDKIISGDARAWIDGDRVRIQVPDGTPGGSFAITYQIRDSIGAVDSAIIQVKVVSADDQNVAPVAEDVEARVIAGTTSRIAIPLENIDPNGDPVRLLGLGSGPQLGRIRGVGDGWFEYEAYPASQGTDVFTYQVIDSLGAVGTGDIRVGVAKPSAEVHPPTAIPDNYTVKPGRELHLPVLDNDYDMDGNELTLSTDPEMQPVFPGADPIVTEDAPREIQMQAANTPGTKTGRYTLMNSKKMTSTGTFTVRVDENAPANPPVAVDDHVNVLDILNKQRVSVKVLENDFDIDGPKSELTLSIVGCSDGSSSCAAVEQDGESVSVPVGQNMKQFRYRVTDADGASGEAVVVIPGKADSVPVLKNPSEELTVEAGKSLTIDINQYVSGSEYGREVKLTSVEQIYETGGKASRTNDRTLTFAASGTYVGPASVVFGVIDDVREEADRKQAVVSIPIRVTPPAGVDEKGYQVDPEINQPPEGPDTSSFMVGQGEPETVYHLDGLYRDPEGSSISFGDWKIASDGTGGKVEYRLGAGEASIYAMAAIDAPKGSSLILEGKAYDANQAAKTIQVQIVVGSSTRPLTTTVEDEIKDANAGSPSLVPVLVNDTSQLDDPKLTLISAQIVSGEGTAVVKESSVEVTPDKDFQGYLVGTYTVGDATNDPDRYVQGTFRVFVRNVPSKPGTPKEDGSGDGFVRISWTSNYNGGTDVESYQVIARTDSSESEIIRPCEANTCHIDGLQNGVNWYFRVTESNVVGESVESEESSPIMPDVIPEPPSAPFINDKDWSATSLTVSWNKGVTRGSTITAYEVAFADVLEGTIVEVKDPATEVFSHEFHGLTTGKKYTFWVRAINRVGPSAWSPTSTEQYPSGPPGKPTDVTVSNVFEDGKGPAFKVSFTAPDNNGATITEYQVAAGTVTGSGKADAVCVESKCSIILSGIDDGKTYEVTVTAVNRDGPGDPSDAVSWKAVDKPPTPEPDSITGVEKGFLIEGVECQVDEQACVLEVLATQSRTYTLTSEDGKTYRNANLINGVETTVQIKGCINGKCSEAYESILYPIGDAIPAPVFESAKLSDNGNLIVTAKAPHANEPDKLRAYAGHEFEDLDFYYRVGASHDWSTAKISPKPENATFDFEVEADQLIGDSATIQFATGSPKVNPIYTQSGEGTLIRPLHLSLSGDGTVSIKIEPRTLKTTGGTKLSCTVNESDPAVTEASKTLDSVYFGLNTKTFTDTQQLVKADDNSGDFKSAKITCSVEMTSFSQEFNLTVP